MMLEALLALARRKGLLEDTSYAKRRVHYQLCVSDDGCPLALIPLGSDEKGLWLDVPVPPKKSVNIKSAFLVETAQYVLGLPKQPRGGEPDPKATARALKCLAAFAAEIRSGAEATHDVGIIAISKFLDRLEADPVREQTRVTTLDRDHVWTGDETIAFLREKDGTLYVHERSEARRYWAARRASDADDGEPRRCLVTGVLAPPARLHPNIKRIPEAQSSGAALVSFNAPAFESHHFSQGENAPVSQLAADGYARAMNWLLERDGERRFRSGVSVGNDAVLVFWTRDENDTPDVLISLFDPESDDEEHLREVFEAAWKGLAPRDVDGTKFYALTMSGNASRVVVRDWLETTAADVKARVRRYFDDLALDGDASPITIGRLLRSLEATDKRGLAPTLSTRLVNAALRGAPFPRELLQKALARLRIPPRKGEWHGTLRARVALIKATLLRLHSDQEVAVSLDEASSAVPYLLGRLFAAMEKLQGDALGDVNASLRDRYFGSASSTPALVFPRLLRISAHHASKAESERRGWAERVKSRIIEQLPANTFPRTLSLQEQGLFAVGYYHQREAFFTPRRKADAEATP